MPVSTPSLFRDSLHFMRNHFTTILLLALWMALLTVCMIWVLQLIAPDHRLYVTASLKQLPNTPPLFALAIARLISYPFLAAAMLVLIQSRSQGYMLTLPQAVLSGLAYYPALFVLKLVTDVATLSGLLLMVLPGLVVMIRWSLAPCILITRRQDLPSTLLQCWRLTALCWQPLLAGYVLIYLGVHLPLIQLLSHCSLLLFNNSRLYQLFAQILLNLTHCWLLVYCFRLYMQLPQLAVKG